MKINTGWIGLTGVLSMGLTYGCENAPPAQSAADQAPAPRARCTAEFGDAAIASVLDGSAIERVEPLYSSSSSKSSNPRLMGASLVVTPASGETAEWLARALECHSAQQLEAQARGLATRSDPFWLPNSGVQIDVTSAGDGFRVLVSGRNSADARAILARAQTLPGAQARSPANATAVYQAR
jgi:hypothetical protein